MQGMRSTRQLSPPHLLRGISDNPPLVLKGFYSVSHAHDQLPLWDEGARRMKALAFAIFAATSFPTFLMRRGGPKNK